MKIIRDPTHGNIELNEIELKQPSERLIIITNLRGLRPIECIMQILVYGVI